MPLSQSGSDVALQRNAGTGKYDLVTDATGNFAFDDTQEHRVLSLLVERRGQWYADLRGTRGSLLYTLRLSVSRRAPSDAEAYATDALKKAVDEGYIRGVQVAGRQDQPGRIRLAVNYTAPSGKVIPVRLALPF